MKTTSVTRHRSAVIPSASLVAFTVLSTVNSACPHMVATWDNYEACSCQGSANGAACMCLEYSSTPAPPGPNDPWQIYGNRCKGKEYNGTDCVRAGYERLYKRDAYGTCQGGVCVITSYGSWTYYGIKPYYQTVPCS